MIVVPEDDLIKAINIEDYGVSQHYGSMIEWISDEHIDIIDYMKGCMPAKIKRNRSKWPHVLWLAPSLHDNFPPDQHMKRRKFTKCLEKNRTRRQKYICFEINEAYMETR